MTHSWNQPICGRCWITLRGVWEPVDEHEPTGSNVRFTRLVSVEQPVRMVGEWTEIERCSWCGQATIFGVFVRADPKSVPYPAEKEDE